MLLDIAFIVLFFAVPFLYLLLLRTSGFSLLKFSMPSFVFACLFVFSYIGIFVLYFGWDQYRLLGLGIDDRSLVFLVFVCSSWAIMSLLLGFNIGRLVFGGSRDSSQWKHGTIDALSPRAMVCICSLFVLCVAILFFYLSGLNDIALFAAFNGREDEVVKMRSLMKNEFSGAYFLYSIFMHDFMYFVSYVLLAQWLLVRSRVTFVIFLVAFFFSLFSSLVTTEKSPAAWYLIGCFIVYSLVKYQGAINLRKIVGVAALMMLLMALFFTYFMGAESIVRGLELAVSRAFAGSISPAYFYLKIFPSEIDFLGGRSFPNPLGLLPYEPVNVTIEVMNRMLPSIAQRGIVGTAPTVFWAEMYANFGYVGVVVSPVALGVYLYFVNKIISRLRSDPIKIGVVLMVSFHYWVVAITGLSTVVVDFSAVIKLFVLLVFFFIAYKGKILLERVK